MRQVYRPIFRVASSVNQERIPSLWRLDRKLAAQRLKKRRPTVRIAA